MGVCYQLLCTDLGESILCTLSPNHNIDGGKWSLLAMENVWSEVKKCVGNAVFSNLKTQISNQCPTSAYSRKRGHACVFSKKVQERTKKGKIFENLGKYVQNLKII